MSHTSPIAERLRRAFADTSRGVLGLVDDLLDVAREHELQFAWRDGLCHVRFIAGESIGRVELPASKAVIRAALARVAALCNEQIPDSVSPYGGSGEVDLDSDPAGSVRVIFVNTPEEQKLYASRGDLPVRDASTPRLLAEVEDELRWTERFATTTDEQWDKIIAEVRRDVAANGTRPLDEILE